jgi:hypothetical protein
VIARLQARMACQSASGPQYSRPGQPGHARGSSQAVITYPSGHSQVRNQSGHPTQPDAFEYSNVSGQNGNRPAQQAVQIAMSCVMRRADASIRLAASSRLRGVQPTHLRVAQAYTNLAKIPKMRARRVRACACACACVQCVRTRACASTGKDAI